MGSVELCSDEFKDLVSARPVFRLLRSLALSLHSMAAHPSSPRVGGGRGWVGGWAGDCVGVK